VGVSPRDHRVEHGSNGFAVGGECVLDARYGAVDRRAGDKPVAFEVTQGLGEHLVGNAAVESLQFVEMARPASEFVQDPKTPFPADRIQRGGQGARSLCWRRGNGGHKMNDRGDLKVEPRTTKCVLYRAAAPFDAGQMKPVIEVRTYRAKPGKRSELLKILTEHAFPIQRGMGVKVLGPLPSTEDEVSFVWLRAFPNEASRSPLKSAFYEGPEWTGQLEASIMPLLQDYGAVVVEDTIGLWSTWPRATG
jgi:hypothetical protein